MLVDLGYIIKAILEPGHNTEGNSVLKRIYTEQYNQNEDDQKQDDQTEENSNDQSSAGEAPRIEPKPPEDGV